MAKAKSQGVLGIVVAICLFLLILFLMPKMVGGARDFCNSRGYRNATDGLCTCITGYHGEACEYKYCPFGKSWFSKPLVNNQRNMELVACSNMGFCNPLNGQCTCRSGFEGSACERLSCATTLTIVPDKTLAANIQLSGSGVLGQPDSDLSNTPQCSGHGLCKTMREMGNEFNGYSLVRAPVNYGNWEADKLQSCHCDDGWEGYDCSQRSCPKGRDPTKPTDTSRSLYRRPQEVFELQCQADSGYFAIFALGRYTEPIPYDADPTYLRRVLEGLSTSAGNVDVIMPVLDEYDGEPAVCGANAVVTTRIIFTEHRGDRPPMLVSRNTSNTRTWPAGGTPLSLAGNIADAVLRFATRHELYCGICPTCFGKVYLQYGTSVSSPVDITAVGADTLLADAIAGLEDLQDAKWTNLQVGVTTSDPSTRICSTTTAATTYINLYSDYGNLPFLALFDASYLVTGSTEAANLTMYTNAAADEVFECSNQGICDYSSGQCQCFQSVMKGEVKYRVSHSDGNGNKGLKGDCGYLEVPVSSCDIMGLDVCNGQGRCTNSTGRQCQCFDGFRGITCELRDCPMGRAWFDEPVSGDVAHGYAPCSNMGRCDRRTGVCKCREGYSGPACDIRDCHRDENYISCSGHGTCVSTATLFQLYGLSYGNVTTDYVKAGGPNWDAYRWHDCLCSANLAAGFLGDPLRPSVGPSALVSGTATGALPLPGWTNWDCSLRNCPKGHTSDRRHGETALKEVQRVLCSKSNSTNTSDFMVFSFLGAFTDRVYVNYGQSQIKAALEANPYIGNVSVYFPNYRADLVTSACWPGVDADNGGFTVQFDTEYGDLPLLDSLYDTDVVVKEDQPGRSTNLECGGSTMGFCDRGSGDCVCNAKRASSDGTGNQPGNAGDCSYFVPIPQSKVDKYTLFGMGKADF